MPSLSADVVNKFYAACNFAYEAWITHRALFDDNDKINEMLRTRCRDIIPRLSTITQEYALLQLVKLHDRAVQNGRTNLTIDYVIDYGGWDSEVASKLRGLRDKMAALATCLRMARNRVLTHNDLQAMKANNAVGAFDKDQDVEYFQCLQEFVNIVHGQCIGGIRPFNNGARDDAVCLVDALIRDTIKRSSSSVGKIPEGQT